MNTTANPNNFEKKAKQYITVAKVMVLIFCCCFVSFLAFDTYSSFLDMKENIKLVPDAIKESFLEKENTDFIAFTEALNKELKYLADQFNETVEVNIIFFFIILLAAALSFLKPARGFIIAIPLLIIALSVPTYLFDNGYYQAIGITLLLAALVIVFIGIRKAKRLKKIAREQQQLTTA